jgi:sensor domain CHASE-containing protein
MKIRHNVIVLLVALFAVLAAAQFIVQQRIVLPSFAQLERDAARKDMDRVANSVARDLDLLATMTTDWGDWDATYQYMLDHNPKFIATSMTTSSIQGYRANAVAFVDLSGKFVWATAIAPGSGNPLDIDVIRHGELPADPVWQDALRTGTAVTGLLRTNRGAMLTAFAPVLNGSHQGPHRGMVLLGRLLTDAEISRIGQQAQVQLTAWVIAPSAAAPSSGLTRLSSGGDRSLVVRDNVTDVTRVLSDVTQQPLLALRIEVPRVISARGQQAVAYSSSFLIGAGVIVLVLMIVLLNRAVLSPLTRMTGHAIAIGRNGDLTSRLDLKRSDELGDLAQEFDRMVDNLASARRQLVDRSFNAGIAENASGVLHNLGNAMTPLAAKVARLQETLRAAPAADVDLVLHELAQARSDRARKADLEELLQLTSRDLAQSNSQALEESNAVADHTQALQRLLADLVPRSRSERILETVRLPALIAESVELVSPNLRARLSIELDSSLAAVGPVSVSRVTLQQVFQNFIVNAAEAVQDVAGQRGTLRIAASVIVAAEDARLHLTFADNGIGIRTDDLPRIFERGFSTKSSATNSGIGLHWCSNAINALGGHVTAASQGLHGGAVLHLILPLVKVTDTLITQAA